MQRPLTPSDVESLQRTIGNTATIHLLAERRSNAPADTGSHTEAQAPDLIQRFPTASEVAARSSKKSKPKAKSVYNDVLEHIDAYNTVVRKSIVPSTLRDRRGAVDGPGYDNYLNKIVNSAQAYVTKHDKKKSDRPETVASFKKLIEEAYLEKQTLQKVVHNNSFNNQKLKMTWREAVDETLRGYHPGLVVLVNEVGLPLSFLTEIDNASLGLIIAAHQAMKNNQAVVAQQLMNQLAATNINGFGLIRSSLFRANIGNVHSGLAQAISNPNFRQTNSAKEKQGLDNGGQLNYQAAQKQSSTSLAAFYGARNLSADDAAIDKWVTQKIREVNQAIEPQQMTPAEETAFRQATKEKIKTRQAWEKENISKDYVKDLKEFEKAFLSGYSLDYDLFNKPLRGNLLDQSAAGFGDAHTTRTENLISAMNGLKPFAGRTYRHDALFPGFAELNRVGAITTDLAFLSTTRTLNTLKRVKGSGLPDVLIIIDGKSGRFMKPLSAYSEMLDAKSTPDESEVLFKAGTRFRVVRRVERADFDTMDGDLKAVLNGAYEKDHVKMIVHKVEV